MNTLHILVGQRSRTIAALFLAAIVLQPRPASAAVAYKFQVISHPGVSLTPLGIGPTGSVVGGTSNGTGFLWNPANYFEVAPPPGETEVAFFSLNVGRYIVAQGSHQNNTTHRLETRSYLCKDGQYVGSYPLNTLYRGINDDNFQAGSITDTTAGTTLGLFNGLQYNVGGTGYTQFTGVTNQPEGSSLFMVSGYYHNVQNHYGGFIMNITSGSPTTTTFLDAPPDAEDVYPQAINDSGAVAGYFATSGGVQHGFLRFADGTEQIVDAPNSTSTRIYGMNNAGTLTGTYNPIDGQETPFLATVVPPYTMAEAVQALIYAGGLDDAGLISNPQRYDLDGDGRITTTDALRIARKVGGVDSNP